MLGLKNPAEVCNQIFGHLGLPAESAVAKYSSSILIHPLDEPTRAASPKSVFAKRPPPYDAWDDSEKKTFEKLCGGAMSLLGYDIPF